MSGEIRICDKNSDKELKINSQDILDFVANYIKDQKISKLEDMTTEEIFNILIQ